MSAGVPLDPEKIPPSSAILTNQEKIINIADPVLIKSSIVRPPSPVVNSAPTAIRNPPKPNIDAQRKSAVARPDSISQIRQAGVNIPLCPICLFLRVLLSSWQESSLYNCKAPSTNRLGYPHTYEALRKTNPIPKTPKPMQTLVEQRLTTKNHPSPTRKNKPNQTQSLTPRIHPHTDATIFFLTNQLYLRENTS